jgi:hypothetical protein
MHPPYVHHGKLLYLWQEHVNKQGHHTNSCGEVNGFGDWSCKSSAPLFFPYLFFRTREDPGSYCQAGSKLIHGGLNDALPTMLTI